MNINNIMDVLLKTLQALILLGLLGSSEAKVIELQVGPLPSALVANRDGGILEQGETEPQIFKFQPVLEGNWVSSGQTAAFGEFSNSRGWARCQFAYRSKDPSSTKMFFLEIVDGVDCCTSRCTWTS